MLSQKFLEKQGNCCCFQNENEDSLWHATDEPPEAINRGGE